MLKQVENVTTVQRKGVSPYSSEHNAIGKKAFHVKLLIFFVGYFMTISIIVRKIDWVPPANTGPVT
jgi:hypothetical protein